MLLNTKLHFDKSLSSFRLIPVASIVTPATLSVQLTAKVSNSLHRVPNLDFRSLSFLGPMEDGVGGPSRHHTDPYPYSGPSQVVLEVTNAVMAQGQKLLIQPPVHAANASWKIDFVGPALKCHNLDPTQHLQIRQNVYDAMIGTNYSRLYGYLVRMSMGTPETCRYSVGSCSALELNL